MFMIVGAWSVCCIIAAECIWDRWIPAII